MGRLTGDVENEDCADCVLEIAGYQAAVSFLASGVPELQPASSGVMGDIFAQKVDAYGGLHGSKSTLSFSSNLLLTKRSMMLVLPVLLSPSRMTLKVRLPIVEEVMDIVDLNNIGLLCRNSNIITHQCCSAPFDFDKFI